MHKINIVSSQAVLGMSSFGMDTRSMCSSPLINSLVKYRLFMQDRTRHWWPAVSIHPHYGFVCGRHDAAWQPRSRNPQDWDLGCLETTAWTQASLAFLDAVVQLLHVRGAVCWCTVLLEQSRYQTLCVSGSGSSMTSLWRRGAASKKSVRDITRISCCVTTVKLPHALHIYSTVFVKKCTRLHFFKVVHQQTIGEMGNSIKYLWADNFCLQQ